MPGMKRSADYQLTSDNQDNEADNDSNTAPSIASEEELSKRRILKVRRDTYSTGGAQTTLPTAGGLFKNLRQAMPDPALLAGTTFGFSGKLNTNSNGLGTTTSGDSVDIGSKPAGKLPGASADAAASPAPTFTFGAQASSSGSMGDAIKPSFSFSFTTTTASSGAGVALRNETAETDKTQPSPQNSNLFGANTFSFAGAVRSFVDARKRLEEDRKNSIGIKDDSVQNNEGDDVRDKAEDHKDGDAVEKFEAHFAVASSGEVLASAPCKLFLFCPKDKKWLDLGESEAKVKHEHNTSEETSGNAQDDANKEKSSTVLRCYRLLVRNGYSLNSLIGKNVFVLGKEGPRHIVFSVANSDGGIANYLLKFTGPSGESNVKKFLEEIKKAMSASEK